MGYDISLLEPKTKKPIYLKTSFADHGNTMVMGGSSEAHLGITYNYANYYYDATEKDNRFAHKEDDKWEYGIRGLYGKTGQESIPMLLSLIERISNKWMNEDGTWKISERSRTHYFDEEGKEIEAPIPFLLGEIKISKKEEETYMVSEGDSSSYWEATAINAIVPLKDMLMMALERPDGIWDGD